MLCPNCNRPMADAARFCGNCGQAIENTASPSVPPPAAAQSTVIRPPLAAASMAGPQPMGGAQMGGSGMGGGGASSAGASAAAAGSGAWSAASARLPGLFERIKNILLTPKTEWPVIEPEPTSIAALYTGYVIPLAGFAAIITFVKMSVIGVGIVFGGSYRLPFMSGLSSALLSFVFGLLGLFLVGLIINALAPTFAGEKNQRQALKVAAYAFTPAWISTVFGLVPGLGTLLSLVAGIYGIYLLYLGLPLLMRSPKEKAGGYTAAVVICTILLGVLLSVLMSATGIYGSAYGGAGRFGGLGSPVLTPEQRQEQAAATAGNILGSMLGTDDKGKASLGAAMSNMAAAGQQMEAQAAANPSARPAMPTAAAAAGTTSTDPTQNAAAATAGLLTALGGALGGGRRVDPVDFHELKAMLPDALPGMQRTNAQASSQQALGVKNSSATGQYQGPGGMRAEIEISDISGVAGLVDMANSVAAGTQSESDTGFEKETTVAGRRAHEKWDNPSRHGEVTVIVAKRFSVSVTGDGVDMSTLEQYASGVDFARLEAMKDVGAQAQ